jgi:hypothetical protein
MENRAMKVIGNLVAGPEFAPICYAIGNLIVGCGSLELQTYIWIEGFSPSERGKWRHRKKGFHRRKCRVIEIVDVLPIEQMLKTGAAEIWSDASKVMEFRNVIVHNPVIFRYDGPDSNIKESIRIPSINEFSAGDFPDFTLARLEDEIRKAGDVNQRLENYQRIIAGAIGKDIKIEYKYGDQTVK